MKYTKNELREKVLKERSLLTSEDIRRKSLIIMNKLTELYESKRSKIVMVYVNFRNEVETKNFITNCLQHGIRVAVPVVVKKSEENHKTIIASEIYDMDIDLSPGTFGILEPKKDRLREIEPSEIDFIVVPGTVFDMHRNRIGYGAGYYDRFLKKVRPDCYKAGVAFEIQVVQELPAEEHDIPLDAIITEKRII